MSTFRICCTICRWCFRPPWFVVLFPLYWLIINYFHSCLVFHHFQSSHSIYLYLHHFSYGYQSPVSFAVMGRHLCSDHHHSCSTWIYLMMSFHWCFLFGIICLSLLFVLPTHCVHIDLFSLQETKCPMDSGCYIYSSAGLEYYSNW